MTAQDVLDRVLAAGGQVVRDATGPRLRAPADLRPLVEEHRAELRRLLTSETSASAGRYEAAPTLTAALLEDFARHGSITEVRVPGIGPTLFFVPALADVVRLMAEGISRGRVWTAGELADMATVTTRPRETWAAVMLAKLALDGDVIEGRPRAAA